jgi:hypothetical protein
MAIFFRPEFKSSGEKLCNDTGAEYGPEGSDIPGVIGMRDGYRPPE